MPASLTGGGGHPFGAVLVLRAGLTARTQTAGQDLGPAPLPASAARLVGAILLYRDAGFTLAEQIAREAISHGLRCSHDDIRRCPNFNAGVTARLAGQPLSRSHRQLHGQAAVDHRA